MPHGLVGYDSIEAGMQAAKGSGKRVFVDITGHGCVNCREMEARVWSDPQVLQKLREDFEIVALYTDDKVKLPESKWITTPEGKVLKDVGRVNSYIARTRFGVNAQPNYIILDANGNILAGPRGYDLSIPGFLEFLK
jgi:thiol:disulfide interchange protein DsbD